jgi:hypothetical protein
MGDDVSPRKSTHLPTLLLLLLITVTSTSALTFLSRPVSLAPILTKGSVKSVESTLTINEKVLHEVSNRLCCSEEKDFPEFPTVGMGGIVVNEITCSDVKFTSEPPPLLDEADTKMELQPGEKMVFFSFKVKGEMELCCVRTCEPFKREVERNVLGGIVMKKAAEGEKEAEEGDENEAVSVDILEELRREREKRERGKSKKKKRKRDNEVFSVKDVQKFVDGGMGRDEGDDDVGIEGIAGGGTGGIRDLLKSELDGEFELIDDPPPPYSLVQLDESSVDAGELLLTVLVGTVEPFPKMEGSDKINLTFDC